MDRLDQPRSSKSNDEETFQLEKRPLKIRQTEKTITEVNNSFEPLNNTDSDDSDSESETTIERRPKKPPPIVAQAEIKDAKTLKALTGKYNKEIKMTYNIKSLNIYTQTIEAYTHVIDTLTHLKIEYHTYSNDKQDTVKRTLKGLPSSITDKEIEDELKTEHLPILTVRQLKRTTVENNVRIQTPLPVWILTFKKTTELDELLTDLKHIFNIKIRLEDYKGLTGITQCYRCQQFGHVAQHCQKQEKCVRCAGNHSVSKCTDKNLKCTNCNGNHPASYRQCPQYIKQNTNYTQTRQNPTANKPQETTKRQLTKRQTEPVQMTQVQTTQIQTPLEQTSQALVQNPQPSTSQNIFTSQDFPPLYTTQTVTTETNCEGIKLLLNTLSNFNLPPDVKNLINIIISSPTILQFLNLLLTTMNTNNGP